MKRTVFALALGAMLALGGTATAGHNSNHGCEVNKAFVVKGVLTATSTVDTQSVNGFDVTGANKHAKNAGFGPDSTTTDEGSFTLPSGKTVKLADYETGESPGEGDKVRVIGKIVRDRCADTYGAFTIKKIMVIDSDD